MNSCRKKDGSLAHWHRPRRSVRPSGNENVEEIVFLSSSSSFFFSLRGGAVIQIQQLPDQSLSKLRSAVALDGVGVRHLVEDVRVIDCDTDAQPEHLLPSLVGLMEDKISKRQEKHGKKSLLQNLKITVKCNHMQIVFLLCFELKLQNKQAPCKGTVRSEHQCWESLLFIWSSSKFISQFQKLTSS